MSLDPMNLLPSDPDWVRKVDEISKAAARDLKCMVLMVAVQHDGKLSVTLDGVPDTGPLADMAKDPPRLIGTLAALLNLRDELAKREPKH